MNEQIKFLKELQEELKTQPDDCQSAPRFWTIGYYKSHLVPEGYGDEVKVVFDDGDREECDIIEYAKEVIESEEYDEHEDFEEFKLDVSELNLHEVTEWLEKNVTGIGFMSFQNVHTIYSNTMFLTKAEAQKHLELNRHHYSSEAHTYAMTAWRAPMVERLMKILETMDWDAFEK